MRHPVALTVTLSFVLLAWCACACALDPSLDISQYAHTAWKVREGFSKGSIYLVAQTPDGYLWLATESGLLRFDGVRAVPWQPSDGEQPPTSYISALLVTHDGTLWIGTLKGLASWRDGKLSRYPEVVGLPIYGLVEDREGTIWFTASETSQIKLCGVRDGKVECHGARALGSFMNSLYQDRKGNLWVSTQTGLWRCAPGPSERYAFPRGVTQIAGLAEDDSGALLLATNDGLKQLVRGKIVNYQLPGITGRLAARRLLRSSDGSLWIGTNQGLLHLHQGRVDGAHSIDGLSGDLVEGIFEDREGNVWVSTTDGLDRFAEYVIPTISRGQGLSGSGVDSIQATSDGSVWIGTTGGLNRWTNCHITVYRGPGALSENLPKDEKDLNVSGGPAQVVKSGLSGTPQSLGLDDAGRLWVSTNDGVFYFDRGRFIWVPGVPGGFTFSIAGDGHGNVWMLQRDGLSHWSRDAEIQKIPRSQFGQKAGDIMLPDKEAGGLWIGFYEGGVVYLQDGRVLRSYGPAEGLGDGRINSLRFGSRGAVWAATEGGLSRIKEGYVETLSSKNGLPCDEAFWSIEDDDHNIWVYMPCGLARIERSEWYAWVDDPKHVIRTNLFDNFDGVRAVGVLGAMGPHVTKSPDGRIWFVPRDGVSVIDPRHLPFNKLPPPVHIEQITADGKTYGPAKGLRLPPRIQHVDIDYTALSLVAPERNRFRFKLEGYDRDWRDAGNRRQAFYTNLPPRNYRFRVMACNNSGVWNEAGASLEFFVLPAFYQTNWFRALCVLVFLALLWGIYQLRILELRRQFNVALDARVNERTRIARELHDTLLQNFHGLLFQFQAASNLMLRRPDEAKRSLDDAINETKKALGESREAIQGLRSEPIAKGNLAELLASTSRELSDSNANEHPPVFDLIEEGERQMLSSTITNEVCRIALELMRNAYQHAQAQRIEAEIRYGDSMFRLRIRDDGRGIDPKVLKEGGRAGHWGLRGVRERADRIGANLDLWSEPGGGTEVQLVVPAEIAYESYRAKSVRKVKNHAQRS